MAKTLWVDHAVDPPEVVSLVEIAYNRKSCSDFVNRVQKLWWFLNHVKGWFNTLPTYRQDFDPTSFFENVGDMNVVLEGMALVSHANANKCIWLSAFIHFFFELHEKFGLSLEEALEIMYIVCLVVEPYKFVCIIKGWIKQGSLPSGCLVVAFAKECIENYGGLGSGPYPRCTAFSLKPISFSNIASALSSLKAVVRQYNRMERVRHDSFGKLCASIKKNVFGAGSLSSQHLAKCLVLSGILWHPALATKAVVAKDTLTCKRIQEMCSCEKGDVDVVLRSVANSLEMDTGMAENVSCEATRPEEKYDLYFVGQSIVKPTIDVNSTDRNPIWNITRFFPDGTQEPVVAFTSGGIEGTGQLRCSTRPEFVWWDDNDPRIPQGNIITRDGRHTYRKHRIETEQQMQDIRGWFLAGNEMMVEQTFRNMKPEKKKKSTEVNENEVSMEAEPDWSALAHQAQALHFPGHDDIGLRPRVWSKKEVVDRFPVDGVFTCTKMVPTTAHTVEPVILEVKRRPRAVKGQVSQEPIPKDLIGTPSSGPPKKKARTTKQSSGSNKLPLGIKHVSLEVLQRSCGTGMGTWKVLNFCGVASICGRLSQRLGHPLRQQDIECHSGKANGVGGFYASVLDLDFYNSILEHKVVAIGKGCIGWHQDGSGMSRLLFATKQEAIDHLLLCIILLHESGQDWRYKWALRLFPIGSSKSLNGIVPVTKSRAKSKEQDSPYFYLVKSNNSTSSNLLVYAVCPFWNFEDRKRSLACFPFNF